MPGHLLVIPKRHVLNLSDLDEDEQKELFALTIEYQNKIMNSIAPGCDIRQHNRPFIPQNDLKIDHVHMHLQPRKPDDELYLKSQINDRALFKPLTEEEMEETLTRL
jgi:diadenosine tetraphosphate (Ap4A) HIT family hydrolase